MAIEQPLCLNTHSSNPQELVDMIAGAAHWNSEAFQALLDAQPVPIYLADADGWITHFNRACVDFAGREPVAGKDRWCVSWRLYAADGSELSHDQSPMAVAIREGRQVRDPVAIAERPDGFRILVAPCATPIVAETGESLGAVNILVDVTDERQADVLLAQAERCRRLANSVSDPQTVGTLMLMAAEYDEKMRRPAKP